MKYGVVFPQTEIGSDPGAIKDFAQAAEGIGFDYLLTYEHVLGADPASYSDERHFTYTYRDSFHEPFVLFGYLAGVTRSLEFATGILILPQRNTVLVAKQAAEVDILCDGRLRLGIGVGWNQAEMEGMEYDFHTRGKRIDEQIELLLKLWTNPLVTFKGQFHHLHRLGINPLPVQRPIPLWFGGSAEPVLQRMARFGQGWIPTGFTPETAAPVVDRIRQHLRNRHRDPAEFGIDARINLSRHPQNTWPALIRGWQALGATHICINTMRAGFTAVQQHIETLREFHAIAMQAE